MPTNDWNGCVWVPWWMITDHVSAEAGSAPCSGSLAWPVGSWIHERVDARARGGREATMIVGAARMGVGIAVLCGRMLMGRPPTLTYAVAGWMIAGVGIGLAHSTSSTLIFSLTRPGSEGHVASSTQLVDYFFPGTAIGLGGALIDSARSSGAGLGTGLALVFAFSLALVGLGFGAAVRALRGRAAPEAA